MVTRSHCSRSRPTRSNRGRSKRSGRSGRVLSNPGPGLLVAAIGDNVAVPWPGGVFYAIGGGTSYAAPTVSAIVSLMLSVYPRLG